MRIVKVELGERSYNICLGYPLSRIGTYLGKWLPRGKVLVITNKKVGGYYLKSLKESLTKENYQVCVAEVGDGEEHKNLSEVSRLYNICIAEKLERKSIILALGGGVIGDIAGFVAATFLRGLRYVQVPTSLLAQVDSSVGGKVAVNHSSGKNLIGTFYQPSMVYIDYGVLKTLEKRELVSGLAEVIKYGVILDAQFFEYLEDNIEQIKALEPSALDTIITRSCQIKARIVQQDEKEGPLSSRVGLARGRSILNFGHTVGHALEAVTEYKHYRHGEAVAIGMIAAGRLAEKLKMVSSAEVRRIESLIKSAGLPATIGKRVSPRDILESMKKDKKVEQGEIRFILFRKIGQALLRGDIPEPFIKEVIQDISTPDEF